MNVVFALLFSSDEIPLPQISMSVCQSLAIIVNIFQMRFQLILKNGILAHLKKMKLK